MTDGELRLRNVQPEDIDEVTRLLLTAYNQYSKSMPATAWDTYVQDIADVRGRMVLADVIVAEVDKHLAGTVTLYLDTSRCAELGWPESWAAIRLLGVHPEFRRNGIGRALMDDCIHRCRVHGTKTIGLYTLEIMDIATKMYERMRFNRASEFDHWWSPDIFLTAYRFDL